MIERLPCGANGVLVDSPNCEESRQWIELIHSSQTKLAGELTMFHPFCSSGVSDADALAVTQSIPDTAWFLGKSSASVHATSNLRVPTR